MKQRKRTVFEKEYEDISTGKTSRQYGIYQGYIKGKSGRKYPKRIGFFNIWFSLSHLRSALP